MALINIQYRSFSLNRPIGTIQSLSRNVCLSVNIINWTEQVSEYILMSHNLPNVYPNIFGFQMFTKWISEYIHTWKITQIWIKNIIWGPLYSNTMNLTPNLLNQSSWRKIPGFRQKKSRIRETSTLSTTADRSTNTISIGLQRHTHTQRKRGSGKSLHS